MEGEVEGWKGRWREGIGGRGREGEVEGGKGRWRNGRIVM